MNKPPFVIPCFIAHEGCPHQCLFCNQRAITETSAQIADRVEMIEASITTWLARKRGERETHFSFYGGSFTCLPIAEQEKMLAAVAPFVQSGDIDCIRLSTRPDCIDEEICTFLYGQGVRIVELGVQSLDDRVLARSKRGHSAKQSILACKMLQNSGMQVGIQLMPGLPGETRASFKKTVERTVALVPSFVRLYPTLVIAGSDLAAEYKNGRYQPLTLDMAVVYTLWAKKRFDEHQILVIRMGLQPSPSLEKNLLAGPYHPAFGELVLSRDWYHRVKRILAKHPGKQIQITLSKRDVSAFTGWKGRNRKRFTTLGLDKRLQTVVQADLERGKVVYVVN